MVYYTNKANADKILEFIKDFADYNKKYRENSDIYIDLTDFINFKNFKTENFLDDYYKELESIDNFLSNSRVKYGDKTLEVEYCDCKIAGDYMLKNKTELFICNKNSGEILAEVLTDFAITAEISTDYTSYEAFIYHKKRIELSTLNLSIIKY